MNLLLYISRSFHLTNGPNEMDILKELLCNVWRLKANDTKCKPSVISRANILCSVVGSALKSRPASLLIEANVEKQSEASAKSRLTTSITDQIGVSSGAIASSSSPSSAAAAVASPLPSSSAISKELSLYKKAGFLVDSCGSKDIFDFRHCSIIPQRLEAITHRITKKLHVFLILLLKAEEHALKKKKMDDFIESIESISVVESADELVFIKMLVEKLGITMDAGIEVCVYSEAFDLLFLSSNFFESKRFDFILESNSNDRYFEQLFCEDKSKEKKSEVDIERADLVRSSSLKYWLTLLLYKD
ncbi:uncharacterized protein EV154DRAFT_555220 [Mucor mucedo]|uniref:uncharacterized protein n=1 Tax=Mucor mucedo TaxID=29922 RepID=UPI00221F0965|nr:uncharacterized protein EV154DRAFT_555220 [Mucor mucedo]KAI7881223.1 hypothetical protein EV154DRAFT_555220 [Mucor mucedo]